MPTGLAWLIQLKTMPQVFFEGALALLGCVFTLNLGTGHLWKGRPVDTGLDGLEGRFKRCTMLFIRGVRHEVSLQMNFDFHQTIQIYLI